MRERSYSTALSMKSALRCKNKQCSAFSKHRLGKNWRMLLFGRISVFYNRLVNFNHVLVKLAFGQPARENNRLKILRRARQFQRGA